MKILVVDFAASEGGALTILKEFYEEAKKDKNNTYVFLLSGEYLKSASNIKVVIDGDKKKHFNRLVFDLWFGRKYVEKFSPDLIFSLQNTIVFGARRKQVIYVHQPIPFQNEKKFSFFKKREMRYAIIQHLLGFLVKKSVKSADGVVVQTKWMQTEVSNKTGKNSKEIFIVKPTVHMPDNTSAGRVDCNVFFYPTSNYLYKNNGLLVDAAEEMTERGITDFQINLTIPGKSLKNIKYLGKIDRGEVLKRLSSSILVFPSYIESFGLPLLEAREIGTIVLAADTAFSREILDGYENAYFFDPFSVESLMCLMERCVKGEIKLKHKRTIKPDEKDLNIVGVLEEVVK